MATQTRRPGKLAPCACSTFEFGTFDPDTEQDDTYTTGCKQMTHRTFAQGHDAKLVGFLVKAELNGLEISRTTGGLKITYLGAVRAAQAISDALAAKATGQLEAAAQREAKKANRPAKAKAPKAAPLPTNRQATIKVGRWTYSATIDATGLATYIDKKDRIKTVTSDKYTEA